MPLGLGLVDRFQWRRYVRNYVIEGIGAPVDFDGYTEFWVDDDADDQLLADFVSSPEFDVLKEDDERFLDVEARFSCEVVNVVLEAATRDPRPDTESVKMVLLWRSGSTSPRDAAAPALRITDPVADHVLDAPLEQVVDPPPAAPFDTLLTLRLTHARAADLDVDAMPPPSWSMLTLDPVETPANRLFGNARATSAAIPAPASAIERNPNEPHEP